MSSNDRKAFIVGLRDLPEDACIEIFSQDWGDTSGLIAYGWNLYGILFSDCTSSNNLQCAKDGLMSVDKAMNICQSVEVDEREIVFKFY